MEQIQVNAPFAMPVIKVPDFSQAPVFNILDFGAEPNNKLKNNQAIASAIELANKVHGRVLIPQGEWLCGKIHLKSHINLHLEQGAILLFSEDPNDYLPAVKTTWEGMECYNYSPLIYAYECENIVISGQGKLKAKLDIWQIWYARPEPHMQALAKLYHQMSKNEPLIERQMVFEGANLRPHFVQFNRCKHILIEDIEIEDSPFWVLHPFLCSDVVIRRVKVKAHGHNNDGVDPEMTQNMLIEDCIFDQGDDAIAIKAGRNQDAWRLNTPTKNLVMRNCLIKRAHQLVALGSELSGGIENVYIHDCEFEDGTQYTVGTGNMVLLKTNERRGGFVRNIYVSNIKVKAVKGGALAIETDVLYQWKDLVPTYEVRLTQIENIQLENIHLQQADFICKIEAQADAPVKNIKLNQVSADHLTMPAINNINVIGFEHN
ncbi:glycoside hydrolase family 28 protein [Catenovulum sp. 2E275]|uniref:glycoside hydrolase family 28 protein n=1 Tax=Catenovulum sp. 2E275 TaxID=2980497 RepID=UPI0021D3796F|nr:glycoside hydrolase family 28 protein [Catenovulum sp. 2E275]MCU4676560.1 glycoside hydrolase family 28 protein [Catenovulum sp. 2E275]